MSTLDEIRKGVIAWARLNGIVSDTLAAESDNLGDPSLVPFAPESVEYFRPPRKIVRVAVADKSLVIYSRLKIADTKIKKLKSAFDKKFEKQKFSLEIEVSKPFKVDQKLETYGHLEPVRFLKKGSRKLIACGSSVGLGNQRNAGTLCALATHKDSTDAIFGISCNHVLGGCSTARPGTPIVVPGIQDVTPEFPTISVVGTHAATARMSQGLPSVSNISQNCDLAYFHVENPNLLTSMQGDGKGSYDTPVKITDPKRDMVVKKWGRSTGFTEGDISFVNNEHEPIEYNVISYFSPTHSETFKGTIYFDHVFEVTPFSSSPFSVGGDSGSLVVTKDGKCAVGIVVAGDKTKSVVLPLKKALDSVGLKLLNGHNT